MSLLLGALLSLGIILPQSQLLDDAKARHQSEANQLRHARKKIIEERKKLGQKLQTSYLQLSVLQDEIRTLEEKVQTAKRAQMDAEQSAKRVLQKQQQRQEQMRLAANLGPENLLLPWEEFETRVTQGLLDRLAELNNGFALRTETQTIVDRRGKSEAVNVIHFGNARAVAVGDESHLAGLLEQKEDGMLLIRGPMFSPAARTALKALQNGQSTSIPVDIDGSLTTRPPLEEASLWQVVLAGGPFVWPIVIVGFLGLLLFTERLWFILMNRADPLLSTKVIRLLMQGRADEARGLARKGKADVERIIITGIDTLYESRENREAALEAALLSEEPKLERSLSLLSATAGIAPLLGLLGTVTGMISTFDVITEFGTGNPQLLSGGISVALITTQLGLIVAVPLILGHAWATRAVERRQSLLEESRNAILSIDPLPKMSHRA